MDIYFLDLNPYAYGYNDPVQFDDPDGRCPWCVGAIIGVAVDYGLQVAGNYASGKTGSDAWTDVDMTSMAASAALGAASGGLSTLSKTAKVTKVVNAANNTNKTASTVKKIEKVEKATSKITGHTKHGLNQSISRNGGKGVSAKAKSEAVKNPKSVTNQSNGTTKFKGKDATVVTNSEGKVVTTFGKSRSSAPSKPQGRSTGGGKAQRRTEKATGSSYNPNIIQ